MELISYVPPDLPNVLLGDPGRLRQILLNLASNAVKFTEQGEIYIKAEMDRAWGHELRIESEEGKGSTFSFSIPFQMDPSADSRTAKLKCGFEESKILVLDDNTTRRSVIKQYLRDWNCEVIEASARRQSDGRCFGRSGPRTGSRGPQQRPGKRPYPSESS